MTTGELWRAWIAFLFKPSSPVPMALYRIFYGLVVLAFCALLAPDLYTWYGPDSVLAQPVPKEWPQEVLLDPLLLLPPTRETILGAFCLIVAAAASLTLGLFTRFSAITLFVGLISFNHHNWLILNSGDALMRLSALYLSFSNAGDAISLDRLIAIWTSRKIPDSHPPMRSQWVQRLMQMQVAFIYCQAFWAKIAGEMWINGSALYYALHLEDFQKATAPDITNNINLLKAATWSTLIIEFSLWTLVWFKETRYAVLAAGVLLHILIDTFMNLPIFEYLMIVSYIPFIYAEDLSILMTKIKSGIAHFIGPPGIVLFNGRDDWSRRMAETLRRLDVFGRLALIDYSLDGAASQWQEIVGIDLLPLTDSANQSQKRKFFALKGERWLTGNQAILHITMQMLLLSDNSTQPAKATG